jgi:hypothetical protein
MRSKGRRFASNARLNPLAEAQASIFRPTALYSILHSSYHSVFPFNEPTRARLLLGTVVNNQFVPIRSLWLGLAWSMQGLGLIGLLEGRISSGLIGD